MNSFPDGGESPVAIATSIPVKQFLAGGHGNHVHVQGHVLPAHVNPYDLIKKYVAESSPPNSLSDSHLSSDGGGDGKEKRNSGDNFLIGSESEEFTESDDGGDDRVATKAAAAGLGDRCVVARFNSFRISGQKIQIYSDCSADNGRSGNYSLSSSSSSSERDGDEEDNDADADDDDDDDDEEDDGLEDRESCYDADVSLTESPRISKFPPPPLPPPFPPAVDLAPPPCKPPRRKSSEKELRPALQRPAAPDLQLRIVDLSPPPPGATSTPQRRTSTLPRPSSSRLSGDSHKLQLSRQTSSESSSQQQRRGSLTSRSRSFAGGGGGSASSRESLLLFGISQNFSSEVMKELYGSKTSLLQHLDQEQQRRKQRLSDPTVAAASGVVSLVDGDARAVPVLAAPAAAEETDLEVSERTGTSQFLFFIQNILVQ